MIRLLARRAGIIAIVALVLISALACLIHLSGEAWSVAFMGATAFAVFVCGGAALIVACFWFITKFWGKQ